MEALQFGPYRVTRKLGEGAIGAVFAATEEGSNRLVAVKVLPRDLAHRSGFRARFEIEIETLRKLDHPNIVHIYGWGVTEGGTIYYVMELVDGDNLEKRVGRQPAFPWPQVVEIGAQLCRALKHAHDRGIIHRDIKPANIMMTRDAQVKLSDFGIARLYGSTGLTMEGGPIGTANYMSPEQTEGKKATERSDLYSMGCTLFALVSGRSPFVADSLFEMLNMHRNVEPPPVRRFAPDVPPELERIIQTLLKKKPEDRLANAAVLLRSLQMVERSQALLHGTETQVTAGGGAMASTTAGPMTTVDPDATLDAAEGDATSRIAGPTTPAPAPAPAPAPRGRGNHPTTEVLAHGVGDATAALPGAGPTVPGTAPSASDATDSDADADDAGNAATVAPATGTGAVSRPATDHDATLARSVLRPTGGGAAPDDDAGAYALAEGDAATVEAAPTSPAKPRPEGRGGTTAARPSTRRTLAQTRLAPPSGQFVTAEQANLREREARRVAALEDQRDQFRYHIIRWTILVLVLLMIGVPAWYFILYRPNRIDQVYARIKAAAKSSAPDRALVEEERDINDFLDRAATDPRAAEVRQYHEEVELTKMESQLRARSLMAAALDKPRPPIERLYSEAMSHAQLEPDVAMTKLQDIMDLYAQAAVDTHDDESVETSRYIELVRREQQKLREQSLKYIGSQLQFLRTRLRSLEQNKAGSPEEARRACRAIIQIFGGRAWAASSVARAKEIMASLPAASQPAATQPIATQPASPS